MKTLKYNLLTIALVALWSTTAMAQSFTKEYKEEFQVGNSGEVEISNKYGDVEVETWNQKRVSILVEVVVNSKSESKADETFDRISIDFSEFSGRIKAETSIQSSGNSWSKGSKYKINYTVKMPINHDLILTNKYGDIYVADLNGNLDIHLKYGKGKIGQIGGDCEMYLGYVDPFKIQGIKGSLELEASYSDLKCGDVGDTNIESKYSDLRLGNVGKLFIDGKYDEYKILSANSLEYSGKYDDYSIGEIGSIDLKSSYSDFEINELKGNAKVDFRYGDLEIDDLGKTVRSVSIEGEYTDVNIDIKRAYNLDFSGYYTSFSEPVSFHSNKKIKEKNRLEIEGFHLNSDAKLSVSAKMKYGELDLD